MKRTAFIEVEGIGKDSSANAEGFAIYIGKEPTTLTNYELVPGLIEIPPGLVSEARPLLGQSRLGAYKFRLRRTDTLAKYFQSPQPRPTATLTAAVTSSATSLTLSGSVPAGPIWIGDEVMNAKSTSSSPGVDRGIFNTSAIAHKAGAFVHTRPHKHRFRRVRLYTITDDGSAQRVWTGYIDLVKGGEDGTYFTLHCKEAPATAAQVMANRQPRSFQADSSVHLRGFRSDRDNYALAFIDGTVRDTHVLASGGARTSSVFKTGEASGKPTAIQIGDETLTVGIVRGSFAVEFQQAPPFEGSEFDLVEDNAAAFQGFGETMFAITEPLHEVAVVSKEMDAYLDRFGLDPVSFTRDLPYPYHPLSIIGALTCSTDSPTAFPSTYDVVNEQLGSYLLPFAEGTYIGNLDDLIESTRDLEVSRAFFGLGGKPYKLFDELVKLARAYGFFQTFDTQGRIGWRKFGLADVEEYDAAIDNAVKVRLGHQGIPLIGWDSAYEETYGTFSATVGETPWSDPVAVNVNIEGVASKSNNYGPSGAFTIDFPYVAPGDAFELKEQLTNSALLLHYTMPRFRMRVEDRQIESLDYDMGALITIDDLPIRAGTEKKGWLLDSATGDPTTNTGDIQFAGRIIGRGATLEDGTYELRVLLTNYTVGQFVRWRAPAMEVTAQTDAGGGLTDYASAANSQFGYEESDSQAFFIGDDIDFVDRDMSTVDTGFGIVAKPSATEIRADAAGFDPVGKFIILTAYDSYSNTSIFSNIAVAWAALADAAGTLGAANDAGDIYG